MKKIDYSWKNLNYFNLFFLILLPFFGVLALWGHIVYEGFNPWLLVPAFLMYALTTFAISGGYHRLFSHRAYKANKWMKLFYLIFGAASGENAALDWATAHRVHHRNVDTDGDPYNIHNGFFFAHVGWVILKGESEKREKFPKDLTNDPLVMWQRRNYLALALGSNILITLLVGFISGDYLGSFAIVGFLRLTFVHHITFFINSLCHMVGSRPYDDKQTARDSNLLALITFGEGYHNFHHSFQLDYRNGYHWYHWDPTKWFLYLASKLGWSYDLKRASESAVLKARMNVMLNKAKHADFVESTKLDELKIKVQEAQKRFLDLKAEYYRIKSELHDSGHDKIIEMKQKITDAKKEFQKLYQEWLDGLTFLPAN